MYPDQIASAKKDLLWHGGRREIDRYNRRINMNAPTADRFPDNSVSNASEKRWAGAVPMVAAALVTLALYAVTLGGTFVYDDLFAARDDPRLIHLDWWKYYWTEAYFPGASDRLYRPLTSMTYAFQAVTTGDWALPFHLVNWLLAALVAAGVARLTQHLAGWWPAMIAGLIFAAHPVHVEAVAGIVGRAELLCGLATLGGLTIYLGGPLTGRRIAGITLCFVAALLSKEQGIFFPAILGMLAGLQWRAHDPAAPRPDQRQRRAGMILALCIIYLIAAYFFFREMILPMGWDRSQIEWGMNPMVHSEGTDRWLMPFVLLGRYAVLLLWPQRLSIDYGAEVIGSSVRWGEPWFYIGVVVAATALALLIRAIRRRDVPVAFALLSAGLLYGVISNLPSLIGTIFAERLVFMPSIFLSLLAGVWLTRLAATGTLARRTVMFVLPILLVLASIRTVTYAALWNDPDALYQTGLAEQPRSVQLHRLVFHRLEQQGKWIEAREVAESCLRVAPNWWRSYAIAARAEVGLGNAQKAEEILNYAKAHHYDDGLIADWMSMGDKLDALKGLPARKPEEVEE